MARNPGKLRRTIESDVDHVWNSSGTIEYLVGSFESQIGDWQIALIHKKFRHKKMTRDKEDDDVWALEDNKRSLEFTFDQNIRIERLP